METAARRRPVIGAWIRATVAVLLCVTRVHATDAVAGPSADDEVLRTTRSELVATLDALPGASARVH